MPALGCEPFVDDVFVAVGFHACEAYMHVVVMEAGMEEGQLFATRIAQVRFREVAPVALALQRVAVDTGDGQVSCPQSKGRIGMARQYMLDGRGGGLVEQPAFAIAAAWFLAVLQRLAQRLLQISMGTIVRLAQLAPGSLVALACQLAQVEHQVQALAAQRLPFAGAGRRQFAGCSHAGNAIVERVKVSVIAIRACSMRVSSCW
ncbi:hypothetical protein D3C78_1190910 [compost metagenome]